VHFNNGLDAREIYPVTAVAGGTDPGTNVPKPGSLPPATNISGSNFKWNPKTGEITPTGGKGQYGGAFDDYGHHFYCSNRNPLMFTVMPYEAMLRNPHAGITQVHEDIATPGAETRVYPLQITHTTADAHAGTNTACSGLGVYRGHLMPELKNNVFVPDPTGQLVTRYKIEPNGASLKATRVGDRTEFFRSSDEWSRPVNFTTGPDGAIYICDIYRRWIDHARFFPEEFVKTHDMRQGENHGRIWRVVPKKGQLITSSALKTAGTAAPHFPALKEHAGRIIFNKLLLKLDADDQPDGQHLAIRTDAICQYPEDPWMAKAALSSSTYTAGHVLAQLLADERFSKTYSANRNDTIRSFASASIAAKHAPDIEKLLSVLKIEPGELLWWKPALLQGLAKLPKDHEDAAKEIAALQTKIDTIIADSKAPLDQRLAVLPLLASRKWAAVEPVMKNLLTSNQPTELTTAAVALLKKFSATSTSPLIYDLLPKAGPALKRDLVTILTANATTALELFKRMDKGEFPTAWVDVEKRWAYQRGKGEMAELAKKLFGEANTDRAKVVTSYLDAAKKPGDAKKGQQVFATICITCHKHGQLGVDVGPPLSDVKVKPPEALLSDILDPNRMFEARWSAYSVETKDGRTLSGLIQNETSDAIVLAMMGGAKETLSRSAIKDMKSLDRTLMPDGLEAAISKEQMSDLIAFLLGK
jgi:putative heme-binding domain-containing protein